MTSDVREGREGRSQREKERPAEAFPFPVDASSTLFSPADTGSEIRAKFPLVHSAIRVILGRYLTGAVIATPDRVGRGQSKGHESSSSPLSSNPFFISEAIPRTRLSHVK